MKKLVNHDELLRILVQLTLSVFIVIVFFLYSHIKGDYNDGDFIAKSSPYYVYFRPFQIERAMKNAYMYLNLIPIFLYYLLAVFSITQACLIFISFFIRVNKIRDFIITLTTIIASVFGFFVYLLSTNFLVYLNLVALSIILLLFTYYQKQLLLKIENRKTGTI